MTPLQAETEAMRLFAVVQGKGDDGSTQAFWRQNPALIRGWIRLARKIEKEKIEATNQMHEYDTQTL